MSETIAGNLDELIQAQIEAEAAAAKEAGEEKPEGKVVGTPEKPTTKEEKPVDVEDENSEKIVEEVEKLKEVKSEEKPAKTFKEILAEQKEQERKDAERKEAEALLEDPVIKLVREARKANPNLSIKEIINSVADLDVDKISDKDLFKNSLAGKNLSEAEIEEHYSEFLEQKDYIKEQYLNTQREKIRTLHTQKQKELGLTNDGKPDMKAVYDQSIVRLEATLEKIVGTELDGVTITSERAGQLYKESQKYFGTFMKDGEVDINEAFDTAFAKLYRTVWKKEIQEKAKSEGKVEAFNELHNPNSKTMVQGKTAGKKPVYDPEVDKLIEDLEKAGSNSFLTNAN